MEKANVVSYSWHSTGVATCARIVARLPITMCRPTQRNREDPMQY